MAKSGEPSVEEILESIKNVMERDSRATAAEAQRRRNADAEQSAQPANSADDEVLDLAEMELSEVVELVEEVSEDGDEPLIAAEVRGAMQENLAALAMLAQPGAKPQIVRSGETSLEGLTRDIMRPMIAEWLEKNLPGMVEKMVQAEIARIAGKRS